MLQRLAHGTKQRPSALILVPTRELAIQVAEAFQKYAAQMPGFHVLPIYGGQSYTPQLNALRRGTHGNPLAGSPEALHAKSQAEGVETGLGAVRPARTGL